MPQGLPYVGAPAEVPYYFTAPDAFRTERSFSTDLSAHYRYRLPHAADAELFVKADVLNVFNRHAVVNSQYLNLAVLTNVSAPGTYAAFNPFTTTPVHGRRTGISARRSASRRAASRIRRRGRSACRSASASETGTWCVPPATRVAAARAHVSGPCPGGAGHRQRVARSVCRRRRSSRGTSPDLKVGPTTTAAEI